MHYQVCIISQDCEIGLGEGETLAYAREEAMESLDSMGRQYLKLFGGKAHVIMADGSHKVEPVRI